MYIYVYYVYLYTRSTREQLYTLKQLIFKYYNARETDKRISSRK